MPIRKKVSGKIIAAAVGACALGAAAIWGVCSWRMSRAIAKSDAQLRKGFGMLASETLEPYRKSLIGHEGGCEALIGAYFGARQADRLEWAGQACLEAGRETVDAYLAVVSARELSAREEEAVELYRRLMGKFPDSPDVPFRLGMLLRKLRRDDAAVAAYLEAFRRAPKNAQLALAALQYFASLQRWTEARQMADALKSAPTDDPEAKLLIARALLRGGDTAGGSAALDQAKSLLASKGVEVQQALQERYADLLKSTAPPAAKK